MKILIDASGCKAGGGIQVTDSVCRQLNKYSHHRFFVVLSEQLNYLHNIIDNYANVKTYDYTMRNRVLNVITGRDNFLDTIADNENIDAVYLIFGPSVWRPKKLTICGFAMPHLILDDSPFWQYCPKSEIIRIRFRKLIHKWNFKILSDCYYTENEYISEKLRKLYPRKKVVTITNNCHQIFDQPEKWQQDITLPSFDGITLLTICANYPHKNLNIIPGVLNELKKKHPDVNVRFVVTVNKEDIQTTDQDILKKIVFLGRVNIAQCPYLYTQCDGMFLPTMLECFSASYAEAMKMRVPILTSDLGFARSLCGDAATYFDPTSASDIADVIAKLYDTPQLARKLIENGNRQLALFDNPETRADKIIQLIETEYKEHNNFK